MQFKQRTLMQVADMIRGNFTADIQVDRRGAAAAE